MEIQLRTYFRANILRGDNLETISKFAYPIFGQKGLRCWKTLVVYIKQKKTDQAYLRYRKPDQNQIYELFSRTYPPFDR